MKLPDSHSPRAKAGFTLAEFMVATAVLLLVVGGAMSFMNMAGLSISAITAQNVANSRAGYVLEFLQDRARLATSISNNVYGNILTLGYDTNMTVDSDGDGKPYNDKNRFERFQFVGVNSTNTLACASNSLVYTPNIASGGSRVLVAKGVRNLPNCKIFTLTNQTTIVLRFGIVDTFARNYYQGVDIQGTAVSLNRPASTNLITILP